MMRRSSFLEGLATPTSPKWRKPRPKNDSSDVSHWPTTNQAGKCASANNTPPMSKFNLAHLYTDAGIRPVTARMRRQLFDILPNLHGLNVLDLFAGTGIIGLESLSRGAKHVAMVESNPRACRAIQTTLKKCSIRAVMQSKQLADGAAGVVEILCCDARQVKLSVAYDVVFVDPPYDSGLLEPALSNLHRLGVCKPGCLVVLRTSKREQYSFDWMDPMRQVQHGDSLLRFYTVPIV